MTLKRYLLNGTNGAALTPANTGAVAITGQAAGQNAATFSATYAQDGATGALFTTVPTGSVNGSLGRFNFNATSSTNAALSFWVNLPASPPTTAGWLNFLNMRDGSGRVYQMLWDGQGSGGPATGGRLIINDLANVYWFVNGASNGTGPKMAAGLYRFELQAVNAATTGSVSIQAYDVSGTQLFSQTFTGMTGRASNWVSVDIGINGLPNAAASVAIDTLQMNDGGTSAIGVYAPNTTPPSITMSAAQTIVGAGTSVNVSVSATAASSSAGIASYVWSLTSVPAGVTAPPVNNSTTATASFTPPAGGYGAYVAQVIVSDAEGNQTVGTTTVTVNAPTSSAILLEQHYEGQSDSTPVTVSNSSAFGDSAASAVDTVNSVVAYSSDNAAHGAVAVKLTMNSGTTTGQADVGLGAFTTSALAVRGYFCFPSTPTSAVRVVSLRSAAGAELGGINLTPAGTIAVCDISGTALFTSSTTTQVVDPTQWYRFEMMWNISTTAGWYKAAIYQADSTSAWASYTSATNLNTGSAQVAGARFGKVSSAGTFSGTWYMDDLAVTNANTAYIGPYLATGPSVFTTLTPGYLELDATKSLAVNGGALSYALYPSTNVLQPSPGIFLIPQGSTAANYTLTVSEAGGGTTPRSVTVPALVSAASSQTTVVVQRYIGSAWQ